MTAGRKRILFVAEALSLSHISRLCVLAKTLDQERYEVHVAAARTPAARLVLRDAPFQTWAITSISEHLFAHRLRRGLPLWTVGELEEEAKSDRRLLRTVQPDLVVSDMRVSMSTSAQLEGVRHAAVVNAQWSEYAAPVRQPPPETSFSPYVPGLTERYFDLVRPLAFWLYTRPINRLRERHGLPSFGGRTSRAMYGSDDVLYLEAPGLIRMRTDLPDNHWFVGPAIWSPRIDLPDWWQDIDASQPLIYLGMGSSGKLGALPTILKALSGTSFQVAAAVGGRPTSLKLPSNVHLAAYLPGSLLARRSTVVISNGGSPGTYQALAEGRPVLGIPQNIDQHMTMASLEHLGATLTLRSDWLTVRRVRSAVERLVGESQFARQAASAADLIRAHPSAVWFPRYVESAVGS